MKIFLKKAAFFFAAIFIVAAAGGYLADGYSDDSYLRFTSPKQTSLILGTSRSEQGIVPSVIDSLIPGCKIYNFSFSIIQSPYGPAYYNAIKKKLDEKRAGKGLFILAVDPWAISSETKDPDDSAHFRENSLALSNMNSVNSYPNYEYLSKNYAQPFFHLLLDKVKKRKEYSVIKKDGWLQVNVSMDSNKVSRRTDQRIKKYVTDYAPYYKLSSLRVHYLDKIINYLKTRGDVYLVRLPIHPRMMEIENRLLPSFDSVINNLSSKNNVSYINYEDSGYRYKYVDGNHLYKDDAKIVTAQIAGFIKSRGYK